MRDVLISALCAPAGQTAMAATTTPAKTSHARAVMRNRKRRVKVADHCVPPMLLRIMPAAAARMLSG